MTSHTSWIHHSMTIYLTHYRPFQSQLLSIYIITNFPPTDITWDYSGARVNECARATKYKSVVNCVILQGDHADQLLVEDFGWGIHTTRGREDKRGKTPMFYFSHPLFVCTSFLLLILSVAGGQSFIPVGWCKGIKNPYVQKGTLSVLVQKLSAIISSLAPSSKLAILWSICTPSSGRRSGSMPTFQSKDVQSGPSTRCA